MTPYIYKILHKPSGRYYIGSQYGKNSDPNNLWKTYITSSKYIKELIATTGKDSFEIIKIVPREDAREYEAKLLKRLYNFFGKEKFLSIMINRNISPGILLTDDIISKANKKRKISNSLAAKKMLKNGNHNFQIYKAGDKEHVRELRSKRMIGNTFGSIRKITDEFREKQSNGAKGNTNVRGTKWWTNGIVNKRSKECPDGFYLGTTKRNANDKVE